MESTVFEILKELQQACSHNDELLRNQLELTQAEFDFFIACRKMSRLNCDMVADAMKLSASRISRVIDSLVQKGILIRETDSKDRRAIKIAFSPKGRRIRSKIEDARNACEVHIKEAFSNTDLELFAQQLQKIAAIIAQKQLTTNAITE